MSEIVLPNTILKILREKAEKHGISIEELLFDVLLSDYNPSERVEKYIKGARELINQAREEFKRGNLRQASEKIWGSCALAIKAHALAKKGITLKSHRELWIYKDEIAQELGDWIRGVFRQADSMHKNFYENLATERDIEDVLKEVEKLVKAISDALYKSST